MPFLTGVGHRQNGKGWATARCTGPKGSKGGNNSGYAILFPNSANAKQPNESWVSMIGNTD
jgi:hypothetical protein